METMITCPSCGHEFVAPENLVERPIAKTRGAAIHGDVALVREFEAEMEEHFDGGLSALGWSASGALFDLFVRLLPTDRLGNISRRRFSAALIACGWEWKRVSGGRHYRPPRS